MRKVKTNRLALVAGLAMALGPLTALSVVALNHDDRDNLVAVTEIRQMQQNEAARDAITNVEGKRLADVAAGAGSLDFFGSVLDAADVGDLLRGQEQYTVFIPVNEAFSALGGEQLSSVLNNTDEVQRLAKAHVVSGRISTVDLMSEQRLRSINGHEITSQVGAELRVNGASIIGTEVAENGIVHYVDGLL